MACDICFCIIENVAVAGVVIIYIDKRYVAACRAAETAKVSRSLKIPRVRSITEFYVSFRHVGYAKFGVFRSLLKAFLVFLNISAAEALAFGLIKLSIVSAVIAL